MGKVKRTWKFYTLFLLYLLGIAAAGYFVLWDEIEKIRELIPEAKRVGKDNCYDNPFLNVQIWTKEGHFHPFYQMQEVVEYFDCLQTKEALEEVRFFYISYNIGCVAAAMGVVVFLLAMSGNRVKWGIELIILPLLVGSGEGVFIYYLAGQFIEDGIGGLTEIYCQLCSSVGLIFWALFAICLLICIYGILKCCCTCSKDRQKGRNVGTIRDDMSRDRHFRVAESEMQAQRNREKDFF